MESKHSTEDGVGKTSPQISEDNGCISAMLLSNGHVCPAVLNAAIQLNLFGIIAKGMPPGSPLSVSEIASLLPNQYPDLAPRLERMLRLLASYNLLSCASRTNENGSTERVYGLTESSKYFVPDDKRGDFTFSPEVLSHRTFMEVYQNYKQAIVDAGNDLFEKVNGATFYEYLKKDHAFNHNFNKVMAKLGTVEMNKVLEIYNGFQGVSTLVDVGGGNGDNLKKIISKHPTIKGINFDLFQVIEHATPYPGIEQIGGDMFENVPKGDAIMLKSVCHNWADEKCVEFLKKCYEALPENGKVIVVEFILPETPEATDAYKLVSVVDNLMFMCVDGKERTEEEFKSLCKRSGFSKFQVACRTISILGVMEFFK